MSTTTLQMGRNTTAKPLVFSDHKKGVVLEFGKAGAEDGSDVQAVPEDALSLPNFVRLVNRGMIELIDADDEAVAESAERGAAVAQAREDRYRSKISSAREEDPQGRDIVYKVEESEKQGKVPTYTQVEDTESARPRRDVETVDLGTATLAGDHDEEGKPTTSEVRVTMGEPLPSES